MNHAKKVAKRGLSLVLTLAMLLSLVSFSAFAAEAPATVSKADLILDKFGGALSDGEKVIARKLIDGTYTYAAPSTLNEDELVVINKEAKTFEAKPYTDSEGNEWTAVKAVLRVVGEEDVALDLGTGAIPVADGKAYSVVVTYAYDEDLTAEADVLAAALRAPAALANGLDAIYKLDDKVLPSMRTLTTNLEKLDEIVHDGLPIKEGSTTKIKIDDEALKAEVETLVAQTVTFDGRLALVGLVEDAGVKQSGLVNDGEEIAAEVDNTAGIVERILASTGWQDLMDAIGGVEASSATEALTTANDMLNKMKSNLAAIGSGWTLDEGVKNVLSASGLDLTEDGLALGGGFAIPAVAIDDTLAIAEADVEASVGQFTVVVKFSADVIVWDPDAKENKALNTDEIESAKTEATEYKFPEESTKEAMLAEIGTVKEDAAKELWAANTTFRFDADKYDRTVVEDLPATLTANANYTVKFVPKTFTYEITGDDPVAAVEVPYGTTIILPEDTKAGKAYDYTIAGVEYMQGDEFVITENVVIERVEGAAYETYELDELAARAVNTGLSDNAKAVLKNPAVKTDVVKLRIPSDENNLVTVEFDGTAYTVTAKKYNSKLAGYWEPITAIALDADDNELETKPFEGNTAVFTRDDVDKIEVVYQLKIDDAVIDGQIDATVNLPAKLKADLAAQEAALNNLTTDQIMSDLELFKGKLDEIKTAVETYEDKFGPGIYDKFKDLLANCVAADGSLIIRNSMESFKAQGMAYYYVNAALIDGQLARLTADLDPISKDAGVKQLLIDKGYDTYQTRMDNIVAALNAANDGLTAAPISAAIQTGSSSVNSLVEALGKDGIAAVAAPAFLELNETLNADIPGRNSIKVTVQMKNAEDEILATKTKTFSYPAGAVVDGRPNTFILNTIAEMVGEDEPLYENVQEGEIPTGAITENAVVVVTIGPRWITVKFVDEEGNELSTTKVTLGKQSVELPASTIEGIRYDYYVNGVKQADTSYTFSKEELKAGDLVIVRKDINIAKQEKLPGLVDKLNKAQADHGMTTAAGTGETPVATFMLFEKDGKQILVLRMTPSGSVTKTDVYGEIAKNIVTSGLYIGIEGQDFLVDSKIYPQSAIDMALNSGFGMERVDNGNGDPSHEGINADGTINEMALEGEISPALTFVPYRPDMKGGYLLETTLQIGTDAGSAEEVQLYVTIEDFGEQTANLKTLKENLRKLIPYFDVSGIDGAARLTIKSDAAYLAYLGTAVAASYAEINDLYNMDHQAFIEFLFSFVQKLIEDEDITLSTYTNTAGEVGIDIDLERYENYYQYFRKAALEIINNSEPDGKSMEDTLSTWAFTYDTTRAINKILERAGMSDDPELANAIAEKIVKYAVAVKLPDVEYVAAVIVPQADKRDIFSFPVNGAGLEAVLAENDDVAAVILLADIPETVSVGKSIVLDLNGKALGGLTVTGEPKQVIVVDSTLDNRGSIAAVSGPDSLTITGGTFPVDVTAYLPNDYIQTGSGKVVNKLFELTLEGDDIIVNLNDDRITLYGIPDPRALAVEVAFDLALNFYGAASMTVNGNELYDVKLTDIGTWYVDITEDDVNEVIDCLNMPGINAFIAEVIEDLTDLQALHDNADGDLAKYEYEFNTWTIDIHKADGADRLALDILSNPENTKTGSITFRFAEGGTYDLNGYGSAREEIKDLLQHLADVTTFEEAKLVLEKPTYSNATLALQGEGAIDVTFDLRDDPGYAVAIGVILAAGEVSNKQDLIDGIVEFIESNYRNHTKLKAAIEAVPNDEVLEATAEFARSKGEDIFEDMVEAIGLTGVVEEDTIKLARTYRAFLVTIGTAIRKINYTPDGKLIGAYETEYGVYAGAKSTTVNKSKQIRRWTVDGTGILENAKLTVKLFREMVPDPIIVTVAVADDPAGPILASKVVDYPPQSQSDVDGLIYLDLVSYEEVDFFPYVGFISPADLIDLLTPELENADTYEMTFEGTSTEYRGDEVVPTGAKLIITAWDSAFPDVVATATYYIINLGDTNCNGFIEAGDALLMQRHYLGHITLGEFALLAADVNQLGNELSVDNIDAGDAWRNQLKYVNVEKYINNGSALAAS